MKLFSHKKTEVRRPSLRSDNYRHAPVMRYYRPTTTSKPANAGETKAAEPSRVSLVKKLKPRDWPVLIVRSIGSIAILIVLIINLSLSGFTLTLKPTDDKSVFRTNESYHLQIAKLLKGSVLNQTKLTFQSKKLEEQILNEFPEIDRAVAIVPLIGRKVDVRLQFEEPLMRLIQANNQQGIISQNGVAILQNDATKVGAFSKLPILSMPGINAKAGQQLLTSEETALLKLLKSEFDGSQKHRPKLRSVEFMVDKRELRARFVDRSFFVKLSPERIARSQVGAVVAALRSLGGQGKLPQGYIDVRVEGRIFVK